MSVLQCPCGMVISVPGVRARCIRCGQVLGPAHVLQPQVVEPTAAVELTQVEQDEPAAPAEKNNLHHRHRHVHGDALLATYVTLVMTSAARAALDRGNSV